ncbi:MAG TPA: hypothetical protein PKC18_16995, partial [Lacipirellulaceae bacterium]|nr:hypothetical protein [Lacipirellulaceae bacterium]
MADWLVITADQPGVGRGVRGHALTWFLRTYLGRRAVVLRAPQQVGEEPLPRTEHLFVGLPTSLTSDGLRRLVAQAQPRRLVAFDYYDRHELAWTMDQEQAFRESNALYFKPWHDPGWTYDLTMGLLPLRTNPRLAAAVAGDRLLRHIGWRPRPRYDVAFLGRPNRTRICVDGQIRKLDQRIDWLRELKREAPELKLWGGVTHAPDPQDYSANRRVPDISDLKFPQSSVGFFCYWRELRRARVLLAPGGSAPWTYRHYECLYAGGVVATIDFRKRDMLVPLPREGMVHVPDGEPVLPAVRQAIEVGQRRPQLAEENVAHLE